MTAMHIPLDIRSALPVMDRNTLILAVMRIAALALASVLTIGCSLSPPKPPRCDGSERRAVNNVNPTVALLPQSKSCGQAASTLGSRDSG